MGPAPPFGILDGSTDILVITSDASVLANRGDVADVDRVFFKKSRGRYNAISEIGDVLKNLRDLRLLRLDYNRILDLGPYVGRLFKLEEANFRHNELEELPKNLSQALIAY